MKVRDVLKRLGEDGWIEVKGGKGSHLGESLDEVQALIREAIDEHVAFLRGEGQPVPEPVTRVEYVDVA